VISRHDYLPFGEEIPANTAGRNSTWGSGNDTVSQKFTGKERDQESGLDYFGARYFGSALGRFTSADPLLNSGRPWDPQTWNPYSYARNNPLAVVDPTGLYYLNNTCAQDDKKCNKQFQQHAKDLKNGLEKLQNQVDKIKDGAEKTRLQNSLHALGTEADDNGVNVAFGATKDGAAATTDPVFDQRTGKYSGFNITIDPSKENGANGYAVDAAHEGTHVSDFENYMLDPATIMQPFQVEYRGYQTSAWAAQALGFDNISYRGTQIWNSSWGAVDRQILQDKGITKVVADKDHPEVQPHNPFPNN
jgi:RHS repeat-associated protein